MDRIEQMSRSGDSRYQIGVFLPCIRVASGSPIMIIASVRGSIVSIQAMLGPGCKVLHERDDVGVDSKVITV